MPARQDELEVVEREQQQQQPQPDIGWGACVTVRWCDGLRLVDFLAPPPSLVADTQLTQSSVRGNRSQSSVRGNRSQSSVRGNRSQSSVRGNRSQSSVQDYYSSTSYWRS
ncbi:hypothetical protein FHG87_013080 [Trinorchestia longiramus]|nr:hypothetical protein FHG87_013080 [Trinorchestia longiramus]